MRVPVAALVVAITSAAVPAVVAEQKQAEVTQHRSRRQPVRVSSMRRPAKPRAGASETRVIWFRGRQVPPACRASLTRLLAAAVEGKPLNPAFTLDSRPQTDPVCLDIPLNDSRP